MLFGPDWKLLFVGNFQGENCDVHHIRQIVLDLTLVDIDDLEAVLDEQLLALDSLLSLPSVVAFNLAQQGREPGVACKTDKQIDDDWLRHLLGCLGLGAALE